jgi:hypothetical protein
LEFLFPIKQCSPGDLVSEDFADAIDAEAILDE